MVLLQPGDRYLTEPLAYLNYTSFDPSDLESALADFLSIHGFAYYQVGQIFLTGIRAHQVKGNIHKIPTTEVNELQAIGRGGLALAKVPRALVVNMGTGTTLVYAQKKPCEIKHIGGSGLGGGTLAGLAQRLFDRMRIDDFLGLATQGNRLKVDLTIGDLSPQSDILPAELTSSNLGKFAQALHQGEDKEIERADIAAGLLNLTLEVIGSMARLAALSCGNPPVVLTGNLSILPQVREVFELFHRFYGMEFIIPEDAHYATAIGAGL